MGMLGQEIVWAKKISDSVLIKEMKMDTSGNFYLLGQFHEHQPFLTKRNPQTDLEWTKTFTSPKPQNLWCNAIEIDKVGDIHVVGSFRDTIIIDTNFIFQSLGKVQSFVAKFSANGNLISVKIVGKQSISSIAFDNSNSLYITGYFADTLTIDTVVYISSVRTAYFAKYVNDTIKFFKYSNGQSGCCNELYGQHIQVNDYGDIFLHMSGYGSVFFDSIEVYIGESNEAVAIFDDLGNIKSLAETSGFSMICDVISDSSNFITTGQFSYHTCNAEAYRYDANGSKAIINGFNSNSFGHSISMDNNGNSFLTGYYGDAYNEEDTAKLFISRNHPGSNNHWQMYIRSSEYAEGMSIVYHNGYNYVLGRFKKLLLTPDSLYTNSIGHFIAKIKDNGSITTNIKNIENSNRFSVYPNPTGNAVTISITPANSKETFTLNVVNAIGLTVYSETLKEISGSFTKQINLSFLPKGIYFLELNSDASGFSQRKAEVKKIVLQ